MQLLLKIINNKFGVDGAVAYTILTRIVQAVGGIIVVYFISNYLNPKEQGYYYTFASILAVQVFFELGLSGIITQYAAHEFAYLEWDLDFQIKGDQYYKSRLSSLLRFCVRWFGRIAFFLFLMLIAIGFVFFNFFKTDIGIDWEKPWVILCLTTSLNLFIDPLLAFFDGLNQVKDMARVRLVQKSLNIFFLFLFFALGFKLYSSALASLFAIIINYFQIFFTKRLKYLQTIWASKSEWAIDYFQEIFPFQWRIAVSWISGYFIFQLFNPVLFATEGPVVAGQMGITIAVLTGISALTMSWINTKVPLLSALISRKDYQGLDSGFKNIFFQSIVLNAILTIFFALAIICSKLYQLGIANRFLTFIPLCCMCVANVTNQIIFALSVYLRCHKKEPLLVQSIIMGLLVCGSTFVFGHLFGVIGLTVGYFFLTVMVALPWTTLIFFYKRREWHQ